jgi:hypothetical protein
MVKDNLLKQDSDLAKKMKDVTRRLIALEQRMNKDSSIQEGPDGADDDTQPLPILPGYRYRYPRIVNDPARRFPDS